MYERRVLTARRACEASGPLPAAAHERNVSFPSPLTSTTVRPASRSATPASAAAFLYVRPGRRALLFSYAVLLAASCVAVAPAGVGGAGAASCRGVDGEVGCVAVATFVAGADGRAAVTEPKEWVNVTGKARFTVKSRGGGLTVS